MTEGPPEDEALRLLIERNKLRLRLLESTVAEIEASSAPFPPSVEAMTPGNSPANLAPSKQPNEPSAPDSRQNSDQK